TLMELCREKDRDLTLVNLFHGVACLLQLHRQVRQRARVGDQQLEVLRRGGLAKGRENMVQRVRGGVCRWVALFPDPRGKGVDPGREVGKTGALKGLEAPARRLDADEVR